MDIQDSTQQTRGVIPNTIKGFVSSGAMTDAQKHTAITTDYSNRPAGLKSNYMETQIQNALGGYNPSYGNEQSTAAVSNPLQSSSTNVSSGLAASKLQAQPVFSGVTNSAADSTLFGNMTNGLGENRFGTAGLALSNVWDNKPSGYQILGAPRII